MGSAACIRLAAQRAVGGHRAAGLYRRTRGRRSRTSEEQVAEQVDAVREVDGAIAVGVGRFVAAWRRPAGEEVVKDIQAVGEVEAAAVVRISAVKKRPGACPIQQREEMLLEFSFIDPFAVEVHLVNVAGETLAGSIETAPDAQARHLSAVGTGHCDRSYDGKLLVACAQVRHAVDKRRLAVFPEVAARRVVPVSGFHILEEGVFVAYVEGGADDAGEVVVSLGADDAGHGVVNTQSAKRKDLVTLTATADDTGGIVEVYNKTGEGIVQLRADEYGNGVVGAFNRKGKGRTLKPGP